MRKIILPISLFFTVITAQAQLGAKSVYAELGGPGVAAINFDTRFGLREDGLGARIGIGGLSLGGVTVLTLPLGVNYLIGKDNKNYFELGANVTPVIIRGDGLISSSNQFRETFGTILLGYRMQPLNGGFTFRAFVSPLIGKGYYYPFYAGISFGYKF
jgi:hypothetical protein